MNGDESRGAHLGAAHQTPQLVKAVTRQTEGNKQANVHINVEPISSQDSFNSRLPKAAALNDKEQQSMGDIEKSCMNFPVPNLNHAHSAQTVT